MRTLKQSESIEKHREEFSCYSVEDELKSLNFVYVWWFGGSSNMNRPRKKNWTFRVDASYWIERNDGLFSGVEEKKVVSFSTWAPSKAQELVESLNETEKCNMKFVCRSP